MIALTWRARTAGAWMCVVCVLLGGLSGAAFAQTPPPLNPPELKPARVFIDIGGRPAGPFTAEQAKAKIASGELKPETRVWVEGMPDWAPAKTVPSVAALFGASPPPLTPGGSDPKTVPDESVKNAIAFLAGTWVDDPYESIIQRIGVSKASSTTIFDPRGEFTSRFTNAATGFDGLPVAIISEAKGTYTAKMITPTELSITGQGTSVSWTVYNNNESPRKPNKLDVTYSAKIIDRNTLELSLPNGAKVISRRQ